MPADTTPKKDRTNFRTFALGLAALLVADVLSWGLVVGVLVSQQHDQHRKDTQHTTDQFYTQCLSSKNSRAGLRVMVHLAFDNQGKPLDLTHIAGFAALDPATRSWVENVAKVTAGSPGNMTQRDQILALFPDPDCDKKFPTHTPGLQLSDDSDATVAPTTTTVP